MPEQKVGIVAECMCDLPKSYLREHGIGIIYFLIETDSGVFTDTDEITSENIISYMDAGGEKSLSLPPSYGVYRGLFEKTLEKYDELIFVAISSGISKSCESAEKAVQKMGEAGKKVHIFDSSHLSTGIGHIVIKAVELAEEGKSAEEIIAVLEEYKKRVSTTFITVNADYLSRSGRVNDNVKSLCDILKAHPVLQMRDGCIKLKSVLFGNYEKAYIRYVRRELKKSSGIEKKRIFITHAGCSVEMVERIKNEVKRRCNAEELIVTKASATISSSCGPSTFGVMLIRK